MNKIKILLPLLFFFLGPFLVYADISITEIAWMGTANSANDEWIEIYNSSSSSVNLSGWSLSAVDGTPSINLSGNIGPGEYKLLERTDDTSFPGISALVIFTGALANEGESLELLNSNSVVQVLDFSSGWPAGDASTKETMQWDGDSWVTAIETAGGPTVYNGNEDDDDNNENEDEGDDEQNDEDQQEDDEDEEDDSVSATSSKENNVLLKRKRYDTRIFEAKVQKTAIAGDPTFFSAQALNFDRTDLHKGVYVWNMGDGTIREYSRKMNDGKQDFYHTYIHPGSYVISLKYYETYFEGVSPDVEETFNIEVLEPKISINKVHLDGSVELKNTSSSTVDLTDWILKDSNGDTFVFPEGSFILGNKNIVLQKRATRINAFSGVFLMTPNKSIVSSLFTNTNKINYSSSVAKKPSLNNLNSLEGEQIKGEVLGDFDDNTLDQEKSNDIENKPKGNNTLVYILSFIVLVLLTVVAVLLLQMKQKEKDEVEDYELIDE